METSERQSFGSWVHGSIRQSKERIKKINKIKKLSTNKTESTITGHGYQLRLKGFRRLGCGAYIRVHNEHNIHNLPVSREARGGIIELKSDSLLTSRSSRAAARAVTLGYG